MESNLCENQIISKTPVSMERDRAVRLFRFLTELAQLRSKVIRNFESYDKVLWLNDIPKERECECIAWYFHNKEKELDFWLTVQQPRFIPAPKTSKELEKWLIIDEINNSSKEKPNIKDKIVEQTEVFNEETGENEYQTNIINFHDYPELQKSWDSYINEKWITWAQEDRRLNKIQNIYKDLYTIYQKQQKLSETYEVIIGIGLLTWQTPSNQEVKRHILTAQASLEFDSKRGLITLSVAGEGAKPFLEIDMLEASERPAIKEIAEINSLVADVKDSIWSKDLINPVLSSFVHSISDQGIYEETLVPNTECSQRPIIHFAPAIILRKRGEKSLIQLFKEIENQLLDEERKLPEGILRLVSIYEQSTSAVDRNDSIKAFSDDDETYFPLLANKDQREIVQKTNYKNGVLVQGPPGTGKSHTIANLICHLLTKGQRVLVTSHTTRALEVLQSKIPSNISALCVSLLGNDQASFKKLEYSVEGINSHYCNWNEQENNEKINLYKQRLNESRKNQAEILNSLRAIRKKETYKHTDKFINYKGTLKEIAENLKHNEERYDWIGNIPFDEEKFASPFLNDKAINILELLRKYNPEKRLLAEKRIISTENIPTIDKFMDFVIAEKEAIDKFNENIHYKSGNSYKLLQGINDELINEILESVNKLFVTIDKIINHRQPFTEKLVEDMLADHDRKWKLLFKLTKEKIANIEQKADKYSETTVSGIQNSDLLIVKNDAENLLSYFKAGKSINFITKSINQTLKTTKYLYEEIRVDGTLCNNTNSLEKLIDWIEINQEFKYLSDNWSDIVAAPKGTFLQKIEDYKDIIEPLEVSLELYELVDSVKKLLDKIPGLEHPVWHKPLEIKHLINILKEIKMQKVTEEYSEKFAEIEKILLLDGNNNHPIIEELSNVIKNRDIENYKKCFETIKNIENQKNEIKNLDELTYKLKSKLPYLYEEVLNDINNTKWDKQIEHFEEAWEFARVDSWLKKVNDPKEYEKLTEALKAEERKINSTMELLVESKAWKHCLAKMTETQRHHLIAWSQDVKLIGKGTGKNASQHRENARKNMNYCREVIPAWIMPIYKVAETIHPGEEMFDVCIIDEASQSGPEALFLYYLAKKIIVVGDDKQISPKFIGVKQGDVDYLRKQYLSDLPLSETFDINRSFFDQSAIRFGDTIRLVEHFRCMPEIIQFSNNLCYSSDPLIPVRQFGADRLEPVKTIYVKNGYPKKSGSKVVNIPEAEEIVNKIAECCEDPAYENKTMGVISLLGEAQAKLIESLLLEKIGAEEIESRKLICGDAYEFQGDERNIIFLSLVSAPSEDSRIGVLGKDDDKKRFNVAASRAQDQLWLFHSATLNDLSSKCLRYSLLSYCKEPKLEITDPPANEVLPNVRHEDFDSLFEQRVFLKIVERGYRVVPQYKIAGYSVDLMVFGMKGRLAVECDGDEFHTAANYEDDMSRQRDLERYGLKFWRVRGSEYYRDNDKSLESLWLSLEKQGITPEYLNEEKVEDEESQIIEEEDNISEEELEIPNQEQNINELCVDKTSESSQLDIFSASNNEISIDNLMSAIIEILEGCPNNSCTKSSLTQRVCSYFGIRTRCKPREILEKRVMKAVKNLAEKNLLEVYKAVNIRIRLIKPKNIDQIMDEMSENIKKIMEIPFDTWFDILKWGRESELLEGYQTGIAYSLGNLAKIKKAPTEKQAKQGLVILDIARKNGFYSEADIEV